VVVAIFVEERGRLQRRRRFYRREGPGEAERKQIIQGTIREGFGEKGMKNQ